MQFSASRPGIVPAGTNGSLQDLQVYETVVAVVQTGSAHGQVQIGSMVLGPNGWRVVDVPHPLGEGQSELAAGTFFHGALAERAKTSGVSAPSEEVQKLLAAVEELDKSAAQADSQEAKAKYNARKADLLEQVIEQSKPDERAVWVRQLADTVSAAVQAGAYPEGVKRLQTLFDRLQKNTEDKSLAAYVRFRQLTAEYGLAIQAKNADFVSIQNQWVKKLEAFVAEFSGSPDTADAIFQLAIAQELSLIHI